MERLMEHVRCDLCGSDDYAVVWNKDTHAALSLGVFTEDGRALNGRTVACRRCGLVYATPRMTVAEMRDFYAGEYRRTYPEDASAEATHAATAATVIEEMKLKPRTFLDVGCAGGALVKLMREKGCDAYGVDPAGEGEGVTACDFEEYRTDMRFDLITVLNTLEHLPAPSRFLRRVRGLLSEGGTVLVTVPNLAGKTVRISTDAFLSSAHLYHFTPETLRAMFMRNGLRVVVAGGRTEEMGEKIYMTAEVGGWQKVLPVLDADYVGQLKRHLRDADAMCDLKRRHYS